MAGSQWWYRGLIALGALGLAVYAVSITALEPFRPHHLAWGLVFLAPLYGVGVLAYVNRPDLPISRLLLLGGSSWALFSGVTHLTLGLGRGGGAAAGAVIATILGGVASALAMNVFALYPDGRYQRAYERWAVRGVWTAMVLGVTLRLVSAPTLLVGSEETVITVANPLNLPGLTSLDSAADALESLVGNVIPAVAVLMVLRYRRSDAQARRQIRWLLLVPLCAVALFLLGVLLEWSGVAAAWFIAGAIGQYVNLGLVPAVLLISILRHRLLDVDVIIRRSLVYGTLWTVIGLAYIGVAAAVGIAANAQLPVALAVLLTVVATVLFQPARRWLERLADRWVFGQRLRGHELMAHLGTQLEATVDQAELTTRLAETVKAGLRVRWAEVVLATQTGTEIARSHVGRERGPEEPAAHTAPLEHRGESLGMIECGPKLDGGFTPDDEQVLTTLARQAALALRNARLTSELAARVAEVERQAAELSASRARIVAAEDAERRRIERDLHDGAQQQVVALLTKVALVRNQIRRRPERAEATLAELESELATLHTDLVELTRGIHPPVLTDRGLAEALRSRAEKLPLQVDIDIAEPVRERRFPDEIEGAAYFVCSEALTNVLKHAHASRAVVRLATADGRLRLTVQDDGVGFNGAVRGHGMANMADRLDALGGRLRVDSAPGAGTTVHAELPVGGGDV